MAQVKEQGGGGEERKETFLPLSLPLLSLFGSCFISRAAKTENPVPRSFFAPNQTETLATQARLHLGDLTLLLMAISCLLFKVCLAVANCVISIIHQQMCYSWYNEVKEKEKTDSCKKKVKKYVYSM